MKKILIIFRISFVGPKGVSCLLYRESFAGMIELPAEIEVGHLIRLHRMKVGRILTKKVLLIDLRGIDYFLQTGKWLYSNEIIQLLQLVSLFRVNHHTLVYSKL